MLGLRSVGWVEGATAAGLEAAAWEEAREEARAVAREAVSFVM